MTTASTLPSDSSTRFTSLGLTQSVTDSSESAKLSKRPAPNTASSYIDARLLTNMRAARTSVSSTTYTGAGKVAYPSSSLVANPSLSRSAFRRPTASVYSTNSRSST